MVFEIWHLNRAVDLGIELGTKKPQGLEFCRVLLDVMQQMPLDGMLKYFAVIFKN